MKNPCKQCLVYPVCRERCDRLDKYRDKLIKIIRWSSMSFCTVIFCLFVLTTFLLHDYEFRVFWKAIITVPLTALLMFAGISGAVESNDISDRMLKRYPQ